MKLYTYGYHGGDLSRLTRLMEQGAVLVDCRYQPFVQAPGWSRGELKERYGAQYIWMKALGNINYKGGPIQLANEREGVCRVRDGMTHGNTVVLLCACKDPATCHRTYVAERIAESMKACEVEIENLVKQPDRSQGLLFEAV